MTRIESENLMLRRGFLNLVDELNSLERVWKLFKVSRDALMEEGYSEELLDLTHEMQDLYMGLVETRLQMITQIVNDCYRSR